MTNQQKEEKHENNKGTANHNHLIEGGNQYFSIDFFDFNLNANTVEAVYTDYEEGMAAAQKAGKPVMLDFTGFGCVNCRKMEAAVWPDAKVRQLMTEDYVLVSLYVDDKTPLPATIEVTEADGSTSKLRTVGDKWSYLQRYKFGAQTQPFYVLVDHEARPMAPSYSYDENINQFIQWLQSGLNVFRQRSAATTSSTLAN